MSAAEVEIRAARPDETDDLLRVLCAAFGLSYAAARPIFYQDPFFDLSHKRLLRTPELGLVSCLTVIPTRLRVGGAWVPMGGIAGVATAPQHQGRGYAGQLLAATVEASARDAALGYPLAGLFAYAEDYYRRLGWERVSQSVRCGGSLAALPDSLEADHVCVIDMDDAAAMGSLHAIHAALTAGRTGACARDHRRWHVLERMSPGRTWVLSEDGAGKAVGYAVYELAGGVLHLREMQGATAAARRGLVGHLARRRGPATRWDWSAAPAEAAAFGLPFLEAAGPVETGLMLRLTDVRAALAAVHAANFASVLAGAGRTLTLRVGDDLRPANACPVRLTATGVVPGEDADPDWIAADIRALAQCYFGYRLPSDIQAQGGLQTSSPAALALADRLFPARAPFVAPLDQF